MLRKKRIHRHQKRLRVIFGGKVQKLLHGDGLTEREAARHGAPERRHAAAAAKCRADIVAERPDIRSLGAADAERPVGSGSVQKLQLVDDDRARLPLDLLTLPRKLIELFSANLDGGIHGRDLLDGAGKARQSRFQRLPCDADRMRLQRFAAGILCVGDKTEAQACDVFLFRVLQKLRTTGRTADEDGQNAGRHRVERSTVADAPLVKNAAQLGCHVLTGPAGGLVYDQNSVCHIKV